MSAATSKARGLRQVGLFALGAVAVHQARYGLAIAAGAHETGAAHRHGYLGVLIPAIVGATVAAVCVSLIGAAVSRRLSRARPPDGATERAALYALGLIAVYLCQELAEGLPRDRPVRACRRDRRCRRLARRPTGDGLRRRRGAARGRARPGRGAPRRRLATRSSPSAPHTRTPAHRRDLPAVPAGACVRDRQAPAAAPGLTPIRPSGAGVAARKEFCMQSTGARLGLGAIAIAAVVVLFIVLSGGDDDSSSTTSSRHHLRSGDVVDPDDRDQGRPAGRRDPGPRRSTRATTSGSRSTPTSPRRSTSTATTSAMDVKAGGSVDVRRPGDDRGGVRGRARGAGRRRSPRSRSTRA